MLFPWKRVGTARAGNPTGHSTQIHASKKERRPPRDDPRLPISKHGELEPRQRGNEGDGEESSLLFTFLTRNTSYDVDLSVKTVERLFLPPPFDTRCADYDTDSSESRDCFNSCFERLFQQQFNATPFGAREDLHSGSDQPKQTLIRGSLTERKRIKRTCRSRCPVACEQRSFYLGMSVPMIRLPGTGIAIHLHPVSEWTRIEYSPRVSLLDLLSLMAYSAAFWFAFCPASLLLHISCTGQTTKQTRQVRGSKRVASSQEASRKTSRRPGESLC